MRTNYRLILDMAGRVVTFTNAHPDDNPAGVTLAAQLAEQLAHATTLGDRQRNSALTGESATDRKEELRVSLRQHFAALAGISRAARKENPDLTVHLRLPRSKTADATFLETLRVAVAEATADRDLFLKYAMPPALLDTITAQLAEFEAALTRQRNAAADQVGASAELKAVKEEIMRMVKHLDSIHRLRFRGDPDLLAAWKSARNVAWRLAEPTPPPEPAPHPPETPPVDQPTDTSRAA
jgi:hypothetical protein